MVRATTSSAGSHQSSKLSASFFQPLPSTRVFSSTAVLAPQDRRLTNRGSFSTKSQHPLNLPESLRPPELGFRAKLTSVYSSWAREVESVHAALPQPLSAAPSPRIFAGGSEHRPAASSEGSARTRNPIETFQSSRPPSGATPRPAEEEAEKGEASAAPGEPPHSATEARKRETWGYDCTQQALVGRTHWALGPHQIQRFHDESKGGGESPRGRTVQWALETTSARPPPASHPRPPPPLASTLPASRRMRLSAPHHDTANGTPDPMSMSGTWETFRSPKDPTFSYDPETFCLPAAEGKTVTNIILDRRPDNTMVRNNAFSLTTAYIDVARPLALNGQKSSAIPRDVVAPPPKGRRGLNSKGFVECLTHDFVPLPAEGQVPHDTSYCLWGGAGKVGGRVVPSIANDLPFKEYCTPKVHPSFFEEAPWSFQPPVDVRKMRKADADLFGAVPDVRMSFR